MWGVFNHRSKNLRWPRRLRNGEATKQGTQKRFWAVLGRGFGVAGTRQLLTI